MERKYHHKNRVSYYKQRRILHSASADGRSNYEQICGGTILTARIVITAAHCVWNRRRQRKYTESMFRIAAAKYWRNWTPTRAERQVYAERPQRLAVRTIRMMPNYADIDGNLNEDIALLVLHDWLRFGSAVRPICVDLQVPEPDRYITSTGNWTAGTVAGWGLLASDGQPSPELRVLQVPLVATDECAGAMPPNARRFVTPDKFCTGYMRRNVSLCKGDSGGGLVTPRVPALGMKKDGALYLQGLVSSGDTENSSCNSNAYTIITNVHFYQEFIRYTIQTVIDHVP